jgi:hypothetical protein
MVRRKRRRSKFWHHRVPDFKLVYCGPEKSPKEESEHAARQRRIRVSEVDDRDDAIAEFMKPKKGKKIR